MKKKMIATAAGLVLLLALTTGCTASATDIGRDAALEAALNDAGVTEEAATRVQVSEDTDDGRKTYDVRFDVDNTEYDYEILASDGKVLSSDMESIPDSTANQDQADDTAPQAKTDDTAAAANNNTAQDTGTQGNNTNANVAVSREQAVQIVLDQVPGATEETLFLQLERDDGKYKYEGSLIHEHNEYDFEIDADSGTVLEWTQEQERNVEANVAVSREQAIQTVLDQVPGATEAGLFLHLDRDDGQYRYEGSLIYQQMEYDFEIDANSGAVLEWSENGQTDDVPQQNNTNSDADLSQEEALQIALDRVPGATAQDARIQLDRDDGKYKYEGEILYQGTEYDFEIDANSGTILEWSQEKA